MRNTLIIRVLTAVILLCSAPTLLGQNLVMSYNLRYDTPADGRYRWDKRKAKVVRKLQADAADIIGFQEALISQVTYLDEQLEDYNWVGVGREDGGEIGEFAPIFYRTDTFEMIESGTQWLSQTPSVPSIGWDASHKRIATWAILEERASQRKLLVINTHFDHRGSEARTNSSQILINVTDSLSAYYNDLSAVVMGDFNTVVSNKTLRPLLDSFDYALTSCINFTECQAAATYIGFPYATERQKAIDHIFTRHLVVESYVVDIDNYGLGFLSDHRSVICRVAFP